MKPTNFAKLLSKYLLSYLPEQRGMSDNTIDSYEKTFSGFLKYCEKERGLPRFKVTIESLTPDLISDYLTWLGKEHGNLPSTQNQRLSAIKAFFRYVQRESPRYIFNCQQVLQIQGKICPKKTLPYLTYDEIKELLSKPNQSSEKGFRDLAMLCLLYDTGARVSELTNLTLGDVRLGKYAIVKLTGKGGKVREVPLSRSTAELIETYIQRHNMIGSDKHCKYLFLNVHGQPFTRAGITYILQKYAPDGHEKITPHVLRHTKAMHLLQSGVNIYYIRNILGHVDIKTTEVYARADTEMKRKAIEQAYPTPVPEKGSWKNNSNLMDWLKTLS